MQDWKFRQLAWEFLALLDTGDYDDIPKERVWREAESGTIGAFIKKTFGNEIDVSYLEDSDWLELIDEWQGFANAIDSGRKLGVNNKGMCLLIAYSLQSMQQRRHRVTE